MKNKILLGVLFCLGIFFGNSGSATWDLPSCNQPQGSGSTPKLDLMTLSQPQYFFTTGEVIEDQDVPQCVGQTSGNDCLQPSCVENYVTATYPQFSPLLIREKYFANARNCGNSACAPPPVPHFSSTISPFYRNISNVAEGDHVRVLIFLHNNAIEQTSQDSNFENYAVKNANIALSWSDPDQMTANISTANANSPSTTIAFPGMTNDNLSFLATKITFNDFYGNSSTYFPTDPEFSTNGTAAAIELNRVYSSFSNIKLAYFDFDVISTATPEMTVVKTAHDGNNLMTPGVSQMTPGQPYQFSISVTNTGNTILENVVASDPLDPNFTFGSGQYVSFSNGIATMYFYDLAPGETATRTFSVTLANSATGQICNPASGQTLIVVATDGTSATASEICFPIEPISTAPILSVTKTAYDGNDLMAPEVSQMTPGQPYQFTVSVTNTGNTVAQNVQVSDSLDPNFTFGGGQYVSFSNGIATIYFYNLAPGETKTRTFSVTLANSATGQICNPDSGILTATDIPTGIIATTTPICFPIENTPPAELAVKKTVFDSKGQQLTPGIEKMFPGESYEFFVTTTNSGQTTLSDVIAIDQLDGDFSFISGDPGVIFDSASHTVEIHFNPLLPGTSETKSFWVELSASATGQICNPITSVLLVATDQTSGVSATAAPICFEIETGNLISEYLILKTAEDLQGNPMQNGDTVIPGQKFAFNITLENTGQLPIPAGISIIDILDGNLVYLVGDPGVSENAGVVTIDFPAINVGTSVTRQFWVRVDVNTIAGTQICNQASNGAMKFLKKQKTEQKKVAPTPRKNLQSKILKQFGNLLMTAVFKNFQTSAPTLQTSNVLCFNVGGSSTPAMEFSKEIDHAQSQVGNVVIFTFVVANTGAVALPDVKIEDTLDPRFTFLLDNPSGINNGGGILTVNGQDIFVAFPDPLLPGESFLHEILVEINTTAQPGDEICNTGLATQDLIPQIFESTDCVTITGGIATTATKTAFDQNGAPLPVGYVLTPGEIFSYQLDFENISTDTIATDELDQNLEFVSFSGNATSNYDQISHTISWNIDATLGTSQSFEIFVKVESGASGNLCNLAKAIDGNGNLIVTPIICFSVLNVSNPVCGNGILETGEQCDDGNTSNNDNCSYPGCQIIIINNGNNSGNGSAPVLPTIGFCDKKGESNFTCTQAYPDWDLDDPEYVEYKNCKKSGNTEAECLESWARSVGHFPLCTPNGGASLAPTGNQTWQSLWDAECGIEEEILAPPSLAKNCKSQNCDYLKVSIQKVAANKKVAVDENATYVIDVFLKPLNDWEIIVTDLKVYDFSIPGNSGWLWNRVLNSQSNNWTAHFDNLSSGENYFQKNDIGKIPSTGENFSLTYEMNTGLTIAADTTQVENVAFAVVEFVATEKSKPVAEGEESPQPQEITVQFNTAGCAGITTADLKSSLGASASVEIVRPFVKVTGGGGIGAKNLNGITGQREISDDQEIIGNAETQFSDAFFDTFKNFKTGTEKFFGSNFKAVADDSGVYFLKKGNLTIDNSSKIEKFENPKTFVIENGDLIINSDLKLEKEIAAFIVRNGNIWIHPDVENIEGIFITENGKIFSSAISQKQLKISGSMMGNARNLLRDRHYIGVPDDNGQIKLEPNVIINFDWRMLENTPPALEQFLGSDWGQPAEN